MIDIYCSWVKGLAYDEKALEILRDCPHIVGVECRNYDEHPRFQSAGLKVSFHEPTRNLLAGITSHDALHLIQHHKQLLSAIRTSDAPIIGFHTIHNHYDYFIESFLGKQSSRPHPKPHSVDIQELYVGMIGNIISLEQLINFNLDLHHRKNLLLETGVCYPFQKHPQYLSLSASARQEADLIIQEMEYFNSPDAMARVFSDERIDRKHRIGFLYDTAHILTTGKTAIISGQYDCTLEQYAKDMASAVDGKVMQLHINRPVFEDGIIWDRHKKLIPGEELTDLSIKIAKKVLAKNPKICTLTIEVEEGLEPQEHAMLLCQQAEFVRKELKF